jgi:hypothetical protein
MSEAETATGSQGSGKESGGRFVQLWVDFLRDRSLSKDARWVGAILATYADRRAIAWPSFGRLKTETELGRETLKGALRELSEKGFLQRLPQRRKGNGRWETMHYAVSPRILREGTATGVLESGEP